MRQASVTATRSSPWGHGSRSGPCIGVLSNFLHEQVHWYLVARSEQCSAAIEELRAMFPNAPGPDSGGAKDEHSTYLHLLVNWLEIEGLRSVVGSPEADEVLHAACRGPAYPWIYRRVSEERDAIGRVVRRHGLDDIITSGGATQ